MVLVVVLCRVWAYLQTESPQIPNPDNDRCLLIGFQSRSRTHAIIVESIQYIDRHSLIAIVPFTTSAERSRREFSTIVRAGYEPFPVDAPDDVTVVWNFQGVVVRLYIAIAILRWSGHLPLSKLTPL